jgi:cell division septum initiation protein DivIVA
MGAGEFLQNWARQQLTNLCQSSWVERRNNELEQRNEELRRQLAAARKISASRLERLQKQKPEKSKKPMDPLPANIVRLVAAE